MWIFKENRLMKDNYFNEFIAPSLRNQVLFRKPTFDEVYEMLMNKKSLICEDVFKLNKKH